MLSRVYLALAMGFLVHETAPFSALLRRKNFGAKVIASRGDASRLLNVQELQCIQSCINCDFRPTSFSHYNTAHALLDKIIQW